METTARDTLRVATCPLTNPNGAWNLGTADIDDPLLLAADKSPRYTVTT